MPAPSATRRRRRTCVLARGCAQFGEVETDVLGSSDRSRSGTARTGRRSLVVVHIDEIEAASSATSRRGLLWFGRSAAGTRRSSRPAGDRPRQRRRVRTASSARIRSTCVDGRRQKKPAQISRWPASDLGAAGKEEGRGAGQSSANPRFWRLIRWRCRTARLVCLPSVDGQSPPGSSCLSRGRFSIAAIGRHRAATRRAPDGQASSRARRLAQEDDHARGRDGPRHSRLAARRRDVVDRHPATDATRDRQEGERATTRSAQDSTSSLDGLSRP